MKRKTIPAVLVRQWLHEWDNVVWDAKEHRAKPQVCFFQFSISARDLRRLSGIYPREATKRQRGEEDLGIQRRHEPSRSKEIARFIRYGYPLSVLSDKKRDSGRYDDLRKPGWLPTAVVVNILTRGDERRGNVVDHGDLIEVEEHQDGTAVLTLPPDFDSDSWTPKGLPPIEVIDGQHRLWAFSDTELEGEFQLPVVAFHGLDLSWQAYLFYTINIKPKRINASLAFDLYPLLRTEEWLTRFEGHIVYRETRAQELVDLLYSHEASPWFHHINMLGESSYRGRMVSQSAWIRSLLATYVKSWEGQRVQIGGLFGAPVGQDKQVLPWSKEEQAAFLMFVGDRLRQQIANHSGTWVDDLQNRGQGGLYEGTKKDLAFYGPHSLLNQDQGIRAFLYITNDFCYCRCDDLRLSSWGGAQYSEAGADGVPAALESLGNTQPINDYIDRLTEALSRYDWRASSAPGLNEEERQKKAAFRGSGGYRELRVDLLRFLQDLGGEVGNDAKEVRQRLGY